MRKGQSLESADLEVLPVGARILDFTGDIAIKQGDGTFKYEDGGHVISSYALDRAYGRVTYYDAPDVEEPVSREESKRLHPSNGAVVLVFDGPPGHQSGRFIEAEDAQGRSIKAGEWRNRGDGTWELRLGRDLSSDGEDLDPVQDHTLWCRSNHDGGPCRQPEALFPMAAPLPADKHAGLRD